MHRTTNPMQEIYARLENAGWKKNVVKELALPSWWKDEDAANPRLLARAQRDIARFLGLDFEKFRLGEVECARKVKTCYKKRTNTTEAQLQPATCVALRALEMVMLAAPPPQFSLSASAQQVRAELMQNGTLIDLNVLLQFSWDAGIPVVHLAGLPTPKPDGMVAKVPDSQGEMRGAIALTKKAKFEGILLFHLAHELGHLALGHVQDDAPICDEEINGEGGLLEGEANAWALELLTGKANYRFEPRGFMNGPRLAQQATQELAQGILPSVAALNWGWHQVKHGASVSALKILEPTSDAPALLRQTLKRRLDLEELSNNNIAYLGRLSGDAVFREEMVQLAA